MDDDLKGILNKVFPVDDVKIIKDMIESVEKDMSNSKKTLRLSELDKILSGVIDD